ncbi:NAD(P)/FAD-dependent oxidoreductase [Pedobacter ginsengisoli]|uniref:NAD(P)/FAD-dependent oxidoreductase n=1 Tax=Pedobacter ginsengisoli TaxID=363852 RepID=UPI00254C415E|nr:FAD-dependent oxidoreductase [Pedobacter ginsengisoli]
MTPAISYWEKLHFFNFDLLIIGSGIVGLSAAIALKEKQPSLNIAVLERGLTPSGASTKNAGFACFGSVSELIEQENNCGTDGLHQLIKNRWKGLLKLRNLLGDEAIAYKNYGGYELFRPAEKELSSVCLSKIGYFNALIKDIVNRPDTFKPVNHQIADFGFNGVDTLILNECEAQIDSGRMMRAMLRKAGEAGILVFNNCKVTSFEQSDDGYKVYTADGNFNCRKLMLCTNAFAKELAPELDIVPGRGQVIITRPVPGLKVKGTFHYNKGYYYFRNVDNRVLLGGGRNLDFAAEQTTEFGSTAVVQNALLNLLDEVILPGAGFEIEQSWSGIMAFGSSITPIVKELDNGVFCALRCNGMGIAIGNQTGCDAAELLLKKI